MGIRKVVDLFLPYTVWEMRWGVKGYFFKVSASKMTGEKNSVLSSGFPNEQLINSKNNLVPIHSAISWATVIIYRHGVYDLGRYIRGSDLEKYDRIERIKKIRRIRVENLIRGFSYIGVLRLESFRKNLIRRINFYFAPKSEYLSNFTE